MISLSSGLRTAVCFTDIFLPLPEGLLANLNTSKDLVEQLLEKLPTYHQDEGFMDDKSAMGAAMQAGLKLLVSIPPLTVNRRSQMPNC